METIKVMYKSEQKINEALDWQICDALKNAGFNWYAQGFNHLTGERDLCFDYEPSMNYKTSKVSTV